jgi:hypothetical protein
LQKRGTQVLVSDSPLGPFKPFHNRAHTPAQWMALDGTLWIENNQPYMIFCHEWIQLGNGTIELVPLKNDLSDVKGNPVTLFKAGDAPWVKDIGATDEKGVVYESLVTDGPFLFKSKNGKLWMIWSSFTGKDYAVGMAESVSGKITGPWKHFTSPLYSKDGGHAMIFKTFDGRLILSLHKPNKNPEERAQFLELIEEENGLKFKNLP